MQSSAGASWVRSSYRKGACTSDCWNWDFQQLDIQLYFPFKFNRLVPAVTILNISLRRIMMTKIGTCLLWHIVFVTYFDDEKFFFFPILQLHFTLCYFLYINRTIFFWIDILIFVILGNIPKNKWQSLFITSPKPTLSTMLKLMYLVAIVLAAPPLSTR